MTLKLKAPFPYMGGKSRITSVIWDRFGTADIYSEPFGGSLAVLLSRRNGIHRREVVNDIDCLLANFWRSIRYKWEETLHYAIHPTIQVDLEAARRYLAKEAHRLELTKMLDDIEYCDPKVGGWWVWAISQEIAMNTNLGSHFSNNGNNMGAIPVANNNPGTGRGIQIQKNDTKYIEELFRQLSRRLEKVVVLNCDWETCVSTTHLGQATKDRKFTASILLDPPYVTEERGRTYAFDSKMVAHDVVKWCRENEDNPNLRIAICGLSGEYNLPDWDVVTWKRNSDTEAIWFSPHCLEPSKQIRMI